MRMWKRLKQRLKSNAEFFVYKLIHAFARDEWMLRAPNQLFQSGDYRDWESACRRLAVSVFVGEDTVLCRTLARFKMYVSTKDVGLAPHLITDGCWELWTTKVMADTVRPGDVCLDVGANIGYYTVLMADIAGPTGKVIAAEPMPGTRAYLKRNVDINGYYGNTEIVAAAFGAEPGEVTVYMPPGEPKNAIILDYCPDPTWEKVTASVVRIDDLGLDRIDFIKIDVEGAEMNVWRGMQATVEQHQGLKIIMEVNCLRYPQEALAFLESIAAHYPMRAINYKGEHHPITLTEVMASSEDVMLYLDRSYRSGRAVA